MIRCRAYAKINLGLQIKGKRPDGLHEIETTLTTINLADNILLDESDSDIVLETPGLTTIPREENLCYRAAELFLKTYPSGRGVKIVLHKNIPVGGGLGGGSADAAAVLRGMRRLLGTSATDADLAGLGRQLGCDVPFLITGGAAYARGVGDELKPFKLPPMDLVIYFPGYSISTRWAYEAYDKSVLTQQPDLDSISGQEKKKKQRTGFQLINDFESVVFAVHPDLQDVKTRLLGTGAMLVSLSGSGSCLYAAVEDRTRKKVVNYLSSIGATYYETTTVSPDYGRG